MATTPILKVYSPKGKYVASCKHLEDAAILVGHYATGAKVRKGHGGKILWHEGHETQPAGYSFDYAAQVMKKRW